MKCNAEVVVWLFTAMNSSYVADALAQKIAETTKSSNDNALL